MKKLLSILLISLMLVACESQKYVEEEVEFVGNTLVESRRNENVAIFQRPNGEILNLKWENKPYNLTEGAIYKVKYQTIDTYTDYMVLQYYDKVDKN